MAATRSERAQTKNWIMGLHLVSVEVANGLIDQEVSLSELEGIYPSGIGIICSANRKPGGTIDDPKYAIGTDPMPQVQNPGMNMPESRNDVGKRFIRWKTVCTSVISFAKFMSA